MKEKNYRISAWQLEQLLRRSESFRNGAAFMEIEALALRRLVEEIERQELRERFEVD